MIELSTVIILIWMHTLADFFLQSDWMAQNKSKNSTILGIHVGIYTIPFFIFGWKFAVFNALAHFATDWITSRMTSKLWQLKKSHWFFCVIGVDQAIHLTSLMVSYKMFVL